MIHKFEREKMYLEIDDVEKIVELEDNKDTYNPYLCRCLQEPPVSKYRLHSSLNDLWLDWPGGHDLKLVTMDYGVVPTKVIFNFPATIVFWQDGTKTIVKCGDDDVWDPEKAIAMCIAKKVLGNTGNYNNKIRKMLEMGGTE